MTADDTAAAPVKEIDGQKQARDELRESERRFRSMLDNLELISLMLDCEMRITYCNDHFLRLTGWQRNDVIGQDWSELFIVPELKGAFRETFACMLIGSDEALQHRENEIVTRSGERRLIRWNNSLLLSTSGDVIGTASIGEDITSSAATKRDLRRSEEQLRIIIDASTDGMWEFDIATGDGYWSDRAYSMLGYTRETFQPGYKAFRALVHPDDFVTFRDAMTAHLEEGKPYRERLRLRHANGSYIPILSRGHVQREMGRVVGVFTDLSIVERSEDALREKTALLADAQRMGRLGGWAIELPDHTLTWSDEVCVIHDVPPGYKPKLEEGIRFYLPEDRALVIRSVELCEKDGIRYDFELEIITAKGRRVWVRSMGEAVRNADGRIIRVQGAFQDISDRKNAELKLQESEERYRLMFDRNPHPTWVYDVETLRFLAVNEAAVQHYGYSRNEFLNMTLKDIRPAEHVPELLQLMQETREDPTPRVFGVFQHQKKDGTRIDVEIASSEITFAGRLAGLVLANDITEKRMIEQHVLRTQRLESLGTLAGGIAHDLNNLLLPIRMGVALLKHLGPSESHLRVLNNMESSVRRGTDLVNQVMLFARGVEGARTAVDIAATVAEVSAIVAGTFPKNIEFSATTSPTLSTVLGDETQLNQVLLNLCMNARDAMPAGGTIEVSAADTEVSAQEAAMHGGTAAGRYVVLEVADNGSGMTKEVMDRIFEPFFTTKELGKGTGLGLSTVRGITRSHAGFVTISSEVGQGSTFRVYLPAHSGVSASAVEPETEQIQRGNGEVILVVDDDVSILDITRHTLETFGYAVLTAEDGAEAIGTYVRSRAKIAVVLTDMMMPVMDGAMLIHALRQINPDVLIIAVSGQDQIQQKALATAYLSKPYTADVMLRTLSTVLGDSGVQEERLVG